MASSSNSGEEDGGGVSTIYPGIAPLKKTTTKPPSTKGSEFGKSHLKYNNVIFIHSAPSQYRTQPPKSTVPLCNPMNRTIANCSTATSMVDHPLNYSMEWIPNVPSTQKMPAIIWTMALPRCPGLWGPEDTVIHSFIVSYILLKFPLNLQDFLWAKTPI